MQMVQDWSDKEVQDFIEQMTTDQFVKVTDFFTTMPKLKHIVKVTNPNTGVESEIALEGMQSFLEQPFHMIILEDTSRLTLT